MILKKEDIELDLIELESAAHLVLEEESATNNLATNISKIKISLDSDVDEEDESRYVTHISTYMNINIRKHFL